MLAMAYGAAEKRGISLSFRPGLPVDGGLTALEHAAVLDRQTLQGTLVPLARLASEELSVKLGSPNLSLHFEALRAADVSGRARAWASLVAAGKREAEADDIVGFD